MWLDINTSQCSKKKKKTVLMTIKLNQPLKRVRAQFTLW